MSEIYISYSGANGFKRASDKGSLSGKVVSYADFKSISHGCWHVNISNVNVYFIVAKPTYHGFFAPLYSSSDL